jgi:hypothetical protein
MRTTPGVDLGSLADGNNAIAEYRQRFGLRMRFVDSQDSCVGNDQVGSRLLRQQRQTGQKRYAAKNEDQLCR